MDLEAIRPAIFFVGLAFDQAGQFHSFQQRGDGIGVAGNEVSQFALSDAVVFEECAQDGELIWRDTEMGDAAAKGLVEAVPGAAQERREAAALGRVDGQLG